MPSVENKNSRQVLMRHQNLVTCGGTVTRISVKSRQFLISSFSVIARTDKHTQTDADQNDTLTRHFAGAHGNYNYN